MSTHILVVDREDEDNFDLTMLCSGVDDTCEGWRECDDVGEENWDDDEITIHDELHRNMWFGWAVRTNDCALISFHDAWVDSASDEVYRKNLPTGRYRIDFDWQDVGSCEIYILEKRNFLAG